MDKTLINKETTVIVSALGTSGDFKPMVAIAKELQRRGYQVIFFSSDYFASELQYNGVPFLSIQTIEEHLSFHSNKATWRIDCDIEEEMFESHVFPARERAKKAVFDLYESLAAANARATHLVNSSWLYGKRYQLVPASLHSIAPLEIASLCKSGGSNKPICCIPEPNANMEDFRYQKQYRKFCGSGQKKLTSLSPFRIS